MHDDLDSTRQSLAPKVGANCRLEISRLAMRGEETSKTLQSLQSLLWRVHKSQMQPEAMEVGGVGLVHRRQVVHSDDRVPPYSRPVPAHELDGLSLAQDIDRVILLQIADQREIFDEDLMRGRVPARIDDENAKARSARRPFAFRAQRLLR